jgi:hypothetical protein
MKEKQHRKVNKITITDILFITIMNYIRENGQHGFIKLSGLDTTKKYIHMLETKNKLLVNAGFINKDVSQTLYSKDENCDIVQQFMAGNEYKYSSNLFHKVLTFIKKQNFGIYSDTYKICSSKTNKSVILDNFYDIALVASIKKQVFDQFFIQDFDWGKYIEYINNGKINNNILNYTSKLFKETFELDELDLDKSNKKTELELRKSLFIQCNGNEFDTIYPAYIISIYDYDKNYNEIDEYIADKVKKLNFDKKEYTINRSKKGTYQNKYKELKEYNSIDTIENNLDKELYKLIENEKYFSTIQEQLYKWYTLSIYNKYKKTNYKNKRDFQSAKSKINKEYRNKSIQLYKDQGCTQKQVAEKLKISLRTVKNYWNINTK